MFRRKPTLSQGLTFIQQSDDIQANEIIQGLIARYKKVHPDWDLTFLSLPRNNSAERKEMIQRALEFLNK